jgi:3-ketosteroid 9alpha-monooxygenase subunit B
MPHDHDYHPLAVADVVDETSDTRSFVFDVPAELGPTFVYAAGQFCTFRAVVDGEPVVRCYSMSSSPDVGEPLTTTVKRVPDGRMSNWMIDSLRVGDVIDVMRPTGLFVLKPRPTPIVAFVGGSGITPVMSIVKSALATTTRTIRVVCANRNADAVLFGTELERLRASSNGRLTVHHHLDDASGFLDAGACAELLGEGHDPDVYVCGPGPYMDTVQSGLALAGVEPDRLFIERFVVPEEAPANAESEVATESLVIRLGRRTHTLEYQGGDTVLEAARRAGLKPPFSCEAGSCATCMAHLDEGTVRMRVNNALTAAEVDEGWVLTCQSVPTSREIVVDYDA